MSYCVAMLRKAAEDHRLSFSSRGVLIFLRSLNRLEDLKVEDLSEPRKKEYEAAVNELERAGYIARSGDHRVLREDPDRPVGDHLIYPDPKRTSLSRCESVEVSAFTPGFLYVVEAEGTDRYKIGRTAVDASERIKSFSTGCPFPIKTISVTEVFSSVIAEQFFHEKYQAQRVKGEWFELTSEQAAAIADECERRFAL